MMQSIGAQMQEQMAWSIERLLCHRYRHDPVATLASLRWWIRQKLCRFVSLGSNSGSGVMSITRGNAFLRRAITRGSRSFSAPPSEPTVKVLSGIPDKHATRRVRIYKPTKVATQQGRGSLTQMWKMQFEKIEGDDRWTNPLMGWTSTGDPLSNMGMPFPNKDAAMKYAERNGFEYVVVEPEAEKKVIKPIAPFKRAMVHHWRHEAPVYDEDGTK